jgi:predicted methyltransferase
MRRAAVAFVLCAVLGGGCSHEPQPITEDERDAPMTHAKDHGRLFRPQDLGLLEAADRDEWQKPEQIMDDLRIAEGSVVADLGAGGGWFTIRLARRVEQDGAVYAEDINPLMLQEIERRARAEGLASFVHIVEGTANDPRLPSPGKLDAALIVDAYHEMEDPADPSQVITLLGHVARALKPEGCLGVVGYNPGGGGPGPSAEDRVDPERVVKSAAAAGLQLLKRESVPPFQFLLIFGKADTVSRCSS